MDDVGDAPEWNPHKARELVLGRAPTTAPYVLDGERSWFPTDAARAAFWRRYAARITAAAVAQGIDPPAGDARYGPRREREDVTALHGDGDAAIGQTPEISELDQREVPRRASFHPCRDFELITGRALPGAPHQLNGKPSWFRTEPERRAYWLWRGGVLIRQGLGAKPVGLRWYGPPRDDVDPA